MKLKASISYMDYYIPPNKVSVDEVLELNKDTIMDTNISFEQYKQDFKEQSGIKRVSVFAQDADIIGQVSQMMDKLFKTTNINASEIKYLVCGNPVLIGDNISIIHYIHKKFSLDNATILPLAQPCISSLMAIGMADKLLNSNEKEYMLIVSGNMYLDKKSRYLGFTVIGDGLSIVLVKNKPGYINIESWKSSYGSMSYEKVEKRDRGEELFLTKSKIIRNGASFLGKCIKEMDISKEEMDIIIHPNTFYNVWHDLYSSLLQLDSSKFYLDNLWDGGHINDIDYVRNLKDYLEHYKGSKENLNVLLFGIHLDYTSDMNYHFISLDVKTH